MDQRQEPLAALRAGNAEAIRAWAAQYAPKVREVGLTYLGGAEEAAALTKRIFAQALSAIRAGYTPADMEDWLLSLARAQGSQAVLAKPAQPLPIQTPQPILRPAAAPAAYGTPAAYDNDTPEMHDMLEACDTPEESPAVLEEPPVAEASQGSSPKAEPLAAYGTPIAYAVPEAEATAPAWVPEPILQSTPKPAPILLYDDEEEEPMSLFADEPIARRTSPFKRFLGTLAILILLSAVLTLIWGLAGLLMRLRLIPAYDLGYSWFNANIHPLF